MTQWLNDSAGSWGALWDRFPPTFLEVQPGQMAGVTLL